MVGRRADELRRSCSGRASFGRRLPGRCAVERGRSSKDLVRAGEVAPVVPSAAGRDSPGNSGIGDVRGPRFLDPPSLKSALAEQARAHGFEAIGVARPDSLGDAKHYFERFIAQGQHGDMDWLDKTAVRRTDPNALWPEARSVIMLGMNYGPDSDPLDILKQRDRGAISVYAQGDDYHELIKSRLKAIARWLVASAGGDVKVFVDTAAVMEKPLAGHAGLGWQGKHTNLVSRQHGSWLFPGAIFTTLELAPDAPELDH